MHELGVLRQALRTVNAAAEKNEIKRIKFITLQVGTESGFVPLYLNKLFPAARDMFSVTMDAELKLEMVPGRQLQIKEIGY